MVSKGSVHGHVTHHFKPEMRTNITTEGSLWEQNGLLYSGQEAKGCKGFGPSIPSKEYS